MDISLKCFGISYIYILYIYIYIVYIDVYMVCGVGRESPTKCVDIWDAWWFHPNIVKVMPFFGIVEEKKGLKTASSYPLVMSK